MGTLIEDINEWYESESYPPDDSDLDHYWDDEAKKSVSRGTTTEQVQRNVISGRRWGNDIEIVYKRGDEYVAVYDVEPATEMQDWGDYGPPEIVTVKPYEFTVTRYKKV